MLFTLSSRIYLDKYEKEYIRILTLNKMPIGPLKDKVTQVKDNKLSEYKNNVVGNRVDNCCFYAFVSDEFNLSCYNDYKYLTIEDFDALLEFLVSNNYTVRESLTKLTRKNERLNSNDDFICYLAYNP